MSETVYIQKINETFIKIKASQEILLELSNVFTFVIPNAQFSPKVKNHQWDGKIRLLDKYHQLYLGLHTHVKSYCDSNNYECIYEDPLDVEVPFSVLELKKMFAALKLSSKGIEITPREDQEKAIIHCIQRSRCLLLSSTSSGKSLIIYSLLRYYLASTKEKILIIVPTSTLVRQMYDDFKDYATNINWNVEDNCHQVFDGATKETDKRIIISTWQALAIKNRLSAEEKAEMTAFQIKQWNKKAKYILDQDYFDQFGTVFNDEVHGATADEITNLMKKLRNAKFRFGTTGTIKDSKTNTMILEGLFGLLYQSITARQLIDIKAAAEISIKCLQLQYSETERQLIRKKDYQDEINFIISHEKRNKFIRNLVLSLKGNTLVLFQYVEKHGEILVDLIRDKIENADRKVFFVHGGIDVEERNDIRGITENETDAIIVGSVATFGTGISIKNIDNIIFALMGKSKIRVLQSIGRGLRISERKSRVTIFDLSDDLVSLGKTGKSKWTNHTLTHFVERIGFYNTEQFDYKMYKIKIS